jgi:hypothetical protein
MMVIPPDPMHLAFTGSSPVYANAEWATGQSYAKDAIRRRTVSGITNDYRAKYAHTSSTANGPPSSFWTDLGGAATTGGYTYTTNVAPSLYAAWVGGVSVAAGQAVWDTSVNRDYVANIAMTSAQNTRPSESVVSGSEEVRSRWTEIGMSNAWAPIDYTGMSKMVGKDSSGAIINPEFTLFGTTAGLTNRVAFAGVYNIQTIVLKVYVDSVLTQTLTKNMVPSGETYGIAKRAASFELTTIAGGKSIKLEITTTRFDPGAVPEIAYVAVGYGYELANTEWGVETSLLSFSKKQRDEVFGITSFLRRGSAASLRATCFIDTDFISGDTVMRLLSRWEGIPVFYDFNNPGSDYDRLMVFGFASSLSIAISAASFESLSMTVEGLVE